MTAVPLPVAARVLGIAPRTLTRWLAAGAPAARPGRRGRGGRALVDPAAISAWRAGSAATAPLELTVFAAEVPNIVAAAVLEAYRRIEGPHKRATAGALAGTWYVVTIALLDRLRHEMPELRDPETIPEQIGQLRAIYSGSRTTAVTD
jgi:hypothetical protein